MPVENKISETIKAVEGVVKAVPVYQDALQPAAKELGAALQTTARLVNVALTPVSALVWGFDQIKDFVVTRVGQKLSEIPPEQIITPKPEVAGPTLEALRYSGHDQDLRELYANLLATSMDAKTAQYAHPGFVEILKNLSPDEARILRFYYDRLSNLYPIIDVGAVDPKEPEGQTIIVLNHSFLGKDAGCLHQNLTQHYIDNLRRLRLLEIDEAHCITFPNTYEPLENDPALDPIKNRFRAIRYNIVFSRKLLRTTMWGLQFCKACVSKDPQVDKFRDDHGVPWRVTAQMPGLRTTEA